MGVQDFVHTLTMSKAQQEQAAAQEALQAKLHQEQTLMIEFQ